MTGNFRQELGLISGSDILEIVVTSGWLRSACFFFWQLCHWYPHFADNDLLCELQSLMALVSSALLRFLMLLRTAV